MTQTPLGDLHKIVTADGLTEFFGVDNQAIRVFGGYGSPPIEYLTQPVYGGQGRIEVDYLLGVRPLVLQLWSEHAVDRQGYWDNRARLHNLLRPNRGGQMILTLQQPSGALRSIYVRANPGLIFPPTPNNNSWLIDEPLELIAFDPVWFDGGDDVTVSGVMPANDELVFPITFDAATLDIRFGSEYASVSTGQFVYPGTWLTYPVITISGPYTSAELSNAATGATINLIVPIAAFESRIISTEPGNMSVVDGNGVNKFGDVDPASNLIAFNIRPEPEAANGINEVSALILGGEPGLTTVSIAYRARYFGI